MQILQRPEGHLAYDDRAGDSDGPLVVAVPGMGDLRTVYDDVVSELVASGHRVVTVDLRGHGDSSTTFTRFGDDATGTDLIALVEHLDAGPAVLLGNSMGGSAATWAAAERPDLVRALVLTNPFLRETMPPATRWALRALFRLLLVRPWGAAAWSAYYSWIAKGRRSPRHAEHVAAVRASLGDAGRLRSLRRLALTLDHGVVEQRLAEVTAPALALVGAVDPDFDDPAAELAWITASLGARGELLADVGHLPALQAPADLAERVAEFVAELPAGGRHA